MQFYRLCAWENARSWEKRRHIQTHRERQTERERAGVCACVEAKTRETNMAPLHHTYWVVCMHLSPQSDNFSQFFNMNTFLISFNFDAFEIFLGNNNYNHNHAVANRSVWVFPLVLFPKHLTNAFPRVFFSHSLGFELIEKTFLFVIFVLL